MTPPNASSTSNVEEEIRALRPTFIMPEIESDGSESDPSEDENAPPEGEPQNEGPVEAPLIEEESEESEGIPYSPDASPTTVLNSPLVDHYNSPPISPVARTIPTDSFHVGEPSRGTVRPRQDEPPMTFIGTRRISSPYRMTVPVDDSSVLYSLSGDPYRPPVQPTNPTHNPDFTLQMYRELQTLRSQQRDLLSRQEYLERLAASDSDRFNYRMDMFEVELMRLRGTIGELCVRLRHLESNNSRRRN